MARLGCLLVRLCLVLTASALVGLLGDNSSLRGDDASEPPVIYTLEIDGKPYALSPNQPVKIEGTLTNPSLTLRVAKTRKLQKAGVTFDYPSYFTYEGDTSDPDVQTWTVSGNDVTVMLFNFAGKVTPQELAESTADALEAQYNNIEPIKLKLGDDERDGVKATMKLGTQAVIQHVISLPETANGSRILVLQEVRSEGEGEAAELSAMVKLLAASLKIKR